jgi:hypothetical protein
MMAAIVQTIEKEKDVNLERKNYLWSNRWEREREWELNIQKVFFSFQPGPEWKYPGVADSIESDIEDL